MPMMPVASVSSVGWYRIGPSDIQTDDYVTANGNGLSVAGSLSVFFGAWSERASGGLLAWGAFVTGDTVDRFHILADGKSEWSTGSAGVDTNLYRSGVSQLKSDGNIQAVDGVATKVKAGTPVDGDFTTTPPTGTIVVDTSANKIWARTGSGTWKGVTIA